MKLAVVGATGLVGSAMLRVLETRGFSFDTLIPVASAASAGREVEAAGRSWKVCTAEAALEIRPDLALFSAGGDVSRVWAPKFRDAGTRVIDNSSAWRMDPEVPLVVPEVNGEVLTESDYLVANPNCSTIQMVVALAPLHKAFGLKRVVVSTYQSVTGTGYKAVDQLRAETHNRMHPSEPVPVVPVYAHPIDLNIIPQIDVFMDNGYTKEEMKMILETRKIMSLPGLAITATAVRLPVMGGHSESINAEFERSFTLDEVRSILEASEGIVLQDNPAAGEYPMPLMAEGKDEVFVGRLRLDASQPNTLNCWVVADNLRKGAATNAVQIAERMREKGWLPA
jgi:aspartate-semialdehyde dehydrogenase